MDLHLEEDYEIKTLTKLHVKIFNDIDNRAKKYFDKQNKIIKPSIIHYKNNKYYVLRGLMFY